MPRLFLDFETRSRIDLRKTNVAIYAADPSTVPLMLAYGAAGAWWQWILPPDYETAETPPGCPDRLRAFIEDPRIEFHAHNAAFEIAIWREVCQLRWGWPAIPLHRWHCTAARAASANQPRALEGVAAHLRLPKHLQKAETGKALIKALSVPVRAQKAKTRNKVTNKLSYEYQESLGTKFFEAPYGGKMCPHFFNNDPELLAEFAKYNLQDIVAEEAVDAALPPPGPGEEEVWRMDRRINERGIPIDRELCEAAIELQQLGAKQFNDEIYITTDFQVEAGTQRERLCEWINSLVDFGPSLAEDVVNEWVEEYSDPSTWGRALVYSGDNDRVMADVLKVLELRSMTAGTAVAKFQAALDGVSPDDRIREQLLYYGATTTGRWAGRGIQPHNMKRSKTPDEVTIDAIKTRSWPVLQAVADMEGTTPLKLLKACVRGIVLAPSGKKFIVSDFAGIESRVLNWLCGNEPKLELFRTNQDTYIKAALDVYGGTEEDIATWNGKKWKIKKEHEEKRQVGKVCELALGYGMGPDKFVVTARKMAGVDIDLLFAQEVVTTWRSSNYLVYEFWKRLERAALYTIRKKKSKNRAAVTVGPLRIFMDPRNYLVIELPSGRQLRYYAPTVDDEGRIFYLDGSKKGKAENHGKIDTYGGKLTENVVQAISRDLLVHSMQIIDTLGLDIVLHVHDEVVVEVDENDEEAFEIVHAAMESIPPWATGLPLMAETQAMRRYSK